MITAISYVLRHIRRLVYIRTRYITFCTIFFFYLSLFFFSFFFFYIDETAGFCPVRTRYTVTYVRTHVRTDFTARNVKRPELRFKTCLFTAYISLKGKNLLLRNVARMYLPCTSPFPVETSPRSIHPSSWRPCLGRSTKMHVQRAPKISYRAFPSRREGLFVWITTPCTNYSTARIINLA